MRLQKSCRRCPALAKAKHSYSFVIPGVTGVLDAHACIVTSSANKKNPLKPPPLRGSYKELDEYFSKHSLEELEEAGIAKKLSQKEQRWFNKVAGSLKAKAQRSRAQLNLAFPEAILAKFMAYAEHKHIPASTLARAWILERLDHEMSKAGNRFA